MQSRSTFQSVNVSPKVSSFRKAGEVGGPERLKHYSLPFNDEGPSAALAKGGPARLFWELHMIEKYDSMKANGMLPQ